MEHFPDSTIQFLECLVKSPGPETIENVKRIVNSFASDFIESISGKKITTAKHLILALELHNMTKRLYRYWTDLNIVLATT